MPLSVKVESDSSPFVKGAEDFGLTNFTHVLSDERACLSEVDKLPFLFTAIKWRGFPIPF